MATVGHSSGNSSMTPPSLPVAPSPSNATRIFDPQPYRLTLQGRLVFAFFLTFFFLFFFLLCFYATRLARRRQAVAATGGASTNSSYPSSSSSGLTQKDIHSLPMFVYSPDQEAVGGRAPECAVCLDEFREGDEGKVVPGCNHQFHAACVDLWLRGHATCPLCRSRVVVGDVKAGAPPADVAQEV